MKIALAGIALGLLVGCGGSFKPSTNADYVRTHHCIWASHTHIDSPSVIVVDGKETTAGADNLSFSSYTCPNGLKVFINDDAPQP